MGKLLRPIALLAAAMFLLGGLPIARASNECANPGVASFCFEVPVPPSSSVLPPIPHTAYHGKYYVWLGVGHCVPDPTSLDCRSWPPRGGSGVPLPTGGTIPPPALIAILFEETNGREGLQRSPNTTNPDATILL